MSDLAGHRVVVTGASRGIGLALARRLAHEGARCVLTATRRENLSAVCAELGDEHRGVALELADGESIARAAEQAIEHLGGIDLLVNNAGLLGERVPVSEYPMDVWRDVMRSTTEGTLDFTQRLLPALADGGAIINVTSGAAGRPNWGAYGVSRLALNAISAELRHELAPRGIRVVAINPGGVRTEMRAAAYPTEDPATLPTPEERLGPFMAVAHGADPGPLVAAEGWGG